MGTKLNKDTYPDNSTPDDFQCFGPPATKDGEFENAMIADMGCFTQDGKDSNKRYHGSVVQHKKTDRWYVYFEWGRTGAVSQSFQFVECSSKEDAQEEFAAQLHSKNDKRGEWATIAGIKTLRAKAGKDCYLVRDLKDRSTGLPDAKRISQNTGAKAPTATKTAAMPTAKSLPSKPKADPQTLSLMRDLNVATVQYTKGAMSDSSVPAQAAIDDARQILTEAQKRLVKVGDDVNDQQNDKDLKEYTNVLYSKIPKTKPIGAAVETWILSKNNILGWQQDLDAFESAGSVTTATDADPFDGMAIEMHWLDPKESDWLRRWAIGATKGRHGYGAMRIHNAWAIRKRQDEDRFLSCQAGIAKLNLRGCEKPLFPLARKEFSPDMQAKYAMSNTHLLFHGSRSVNIAGILRKSLLLPKQLVGVVITGAMYGGGVYTADDWQKSAGYTSLSSSYWSHGSGGVKGRNAFMFLVDIVLGKPFVAPGPRGYTEAPAGYHSVFGKAGASGVQNNEFIVYKTEQHLLKYLIEFSV